MVPPFWPWIGKKQVKSCHAFGRDQMPHSIGGVDSNYSRIVQTSMRNFAANVSNTTKQAFHAEEIVLWICGGQGGKECAITAAKIDFDRPRTREYLVEVQPRYQRFWNVFD